MLICATIVLLSFLNSNTAFFLFKCFSKKQFGQDCSNAITFESWGVFSQICR